MRISKKLVMILTTIVSVPVYANNLPDNFVYLRDIDSSIQQDMRYSSYHNFIGHPIKGYESAECILTRPAAEALSKVQADLRKTGFSLKVYDCYRPQKAVNEFIVWSKQPKHQEMKAEFYPRVNKADFFELGYVAEKSGHTRGSTVDITIVPVPTPKQPTFLLKQRLSACYGAYKKRFHDNSIDMGTGYDCMDELSHSNNQEISKTAYKNRQLLFWIMEKYGFVNLPSEWWHFTLKNELYVDTYFDFNVQSKIPSSLAIPSNSKQLVIVRAKALNTYRAEMQRYERDSSKEMWRPVGKAIPVVIGEHGIAVSEKKEGDLHTPTGVFKIGTAFGFAPTEKNVKLPYLALASTSVCVDDSASHYYNEIVNQANIENADWRSAEKMRHIPLYKMGAVIAYNDKRIPGSGSCIFMHIWRNENKGTAGCIAMAEPALKETLAWFEPEKQPIVAILNSFLL